MIKILIVDDEPLVRAGIKTVVPWSDNGFEVVGEAWNGIDAYNKILDLKPDILITDIKMPQMDGIELLKKIKSEKLPVQTVVLSCFDEFELVREAMKYGARDYFLKLSIDPNKILEILNEIKQDMVMAEGSPAQIPLDTSDLKYLFFKKLIKNGFSSEEQISNTVRNLHLSVAFRNYCLVLFSFDAEISEPFDADRDKMIYNLLDQLCQRHPGNEIISVDANTYLLIQNTYDNNFLYRQISATMKQYANRTVYYGISSILKDYVSFCSGIQQAKEALNSCIFYKKASPLSYEMLTTENFPSITNTQEQELHVSLATGNRNKSNELVSQLTILLNDGIFFTSKCYSYLVELLNIYVRVAREQNFSIQQVSWNNNDIFEAIKQAKTLSACSQVISDFTDSFISFIQEQKYGERSEILKIKEYVQTHYMEHIDLNTISALVNITPSHLSNVFKKETGVNFSTYLTDVRMHIAKKLLQSSQLLIYEIAEQTGYSDAGYFGKAFKKYWGITPEELKKRL